MKKSLPTECPEKILLRYHDGSRQLRQWTRRCSCTPVETPHVSSRAAATSGPLLPLPLCQLREKGWWPQICSTGNAAAFAHEQWKTQGEHMEASANPLIGDFIEWLSQVPFALPSLLYVCLTSRSMGRLVARAYLDLMYYCTVCISAVRVRRYGIRKYSIRRYSIVESELPHQTPNGRRVGFIQSTNDCASSSSSSEAISLAEAASCRYAFC